MYIFAYLCRLVLFVLKTNIVIELHLLFITFIIVVPCGYCGDKKDLMAARSVKINENNNFANFLPINISPTCTVYELLSILTGLFPRKKSSRTRLSLSSAPTAGKKNSVSAVNPF
jgi:hypothetical protein